MDQELPDHQRQPAFCYSVVYAALPDTAAPVELAELPFTYTSVYVEEPDETPALLASANNAIRAAFAAADHVTGHQFTSDLGVLPTPAPHRCPTSPPPARAGGPGASASWPTVTSSTPHTTPIMCWPAHRAAWSTCAPISAWTSPNPSGAVCP